MKAPVLIPVGRHGYLIGHLLHGRGLYVGQRVTRRKQRVLLAVKPARPGWDLQRVSLDAKRPAIIVAVDASKIGVNIFVSSTSL